MNGKIYNGGFGLRGGFYKGIAENSIFSVSLGFSVNNFDLYETYLDKEGAYEIKTRKNGNTNYAAIALHSGVMYGVNKYIGLGVKGLVDYNKKAFNAGVAGYISINLFDWYEKFGF